MMGFPQFTPFFMSVDYPERFANRLIAWQRQHGRHDLPWQNTRDTYRIWLSEIMLQQTQVVAVIPYYERFLARFPDVSALAAAPLEAVLENWAGLGYYARARHLHQAATTVTEKWGGVFPDSAEELARLPGIGRSTAAAIAVFSQGERAAILDGNVRRVLCRHRGIEGFPGEPLVERSLWKLAEHLLPEADIVAYTQGLMDLGATVCTRHRPRCQACPVAADCVARQEDIAHRLPTPRPRAPRRERATDFVFIVAGGKVLLQRRPPVGIWGGLLAPPEGDPAMLLATLGLPLLTAERREEVVHDFTHFRLRITPWRVRLPNLPPMAMDPALVWLDLDASDSAPLPAPVRSLLAGFRADLRRVASAED